MVREFSSGVFVHRLAGVKATGKFSWVFDRESGCHYQIMAGLVRAINLTRCLMKPLVCGSIWKATITSNCRNYAVVSKETFKNSWEIDTRVVKDVVLYSYENTRFHKLLNIFALSQFVFWIYLAEFSASTLRDAPVEKKDNSDVSDDVPWYRNINLGANKFRNGITFMCLSVGMRIPEISWKNVT